MNWNEQKLDPNQSMQEVVDLLKQMYTDQPVLLFLAADGPAFQSEEDFQLVHQLEEEGAIPPIWGLVIPAERKDESVRLFAARQGFTFAETRDAAVKLWKTTEQNSPSVSSELPLGQSPTLAKNKRSRRFPFAALSLLLIVIAALGALLLRPPSLPVRPAAQTTAGGLAAFASDQQGGLNDELQIRLPALPTGNGQTYTAWLLTDEAQSDALWLRLGTITPNGQAQTLTPSDGSHPNLLSTYSQVCMTTSSSSSFIPTSHSACRYYGHITQIPNDNDPDHYSYLDHVRHLLAADPTLEAAHIHNGLAFNWNFQISKIFEWASAANRTTGDMPLVHRHMVRILDALDGLAFVQRDVPTGTPVLVDPMSIHFGVLIGDTQTLSYLAHIERHLRGILSSPGVTSDQERLAVHLLEDMQQIAAELETVYTDARVLVRMTDAQLAHATAMLQDLATNASNAYAGGYATALDQTRTDGSKDLSIAFQQFGILDMYKE